MSKVQFFASLQVFFGRPIKRIYSRYIGHATVLKVDNDLRRVIIDIELFIEGRDGSKEKRAVDLVMLHARGIGVFAGPMRFSRPSVSPTPAMINA